VTGWEGAAARLEGRLVVVEPLGEQHEEDLWEAAKDPEVWRWLPWNAAADRESFHHWLEDALGRRDAGLEVPFAVVERRSGKAIGSTRYLTLRPEHRGLEIGWTWNASSAWGTGANTEAKLLLLRHAFEGLGCIRVEFKTDALNERSRVALEALPARFEGIFRKHMLVRDDALRDSAYYAITDDEWPAVKANLERRLQAK
jgi:RimJ/RimL family protein N-acetyltransferase